MSRHTTVGAAGLMCLAARVASPQTVLENDQMRLELIGLKRWTVSMIQDSLRRMGGVAPQPLTPLRALARTTRPSATPQSHLYLSRIHLRADRKIAFVLARSSASATLSLRRAR
jgi:hypothetical protein